MLTPEDIHQRFPAFEKDLTEEMSRQADVKYVHEGDMLMKTGQYFRSIMLVVSGVLKVFREDEEGNEYFMYYLQPGQACALSMICAVRKQASQLKVQAASEAEVITVPLEFMDSWMQQYKSWYYFVLENYRNRFQELLLTIDHIAFRNMDERLLYYLQRKQQMLGTNTITINYTEAAQELNSSREVISRLVKKLSEKGMVELHGNHQVKILSLLTD